ncbi:hypothetical protein G6F66_015699 [Rhizopus arrhizus]|nr:hypothetical protein G6F66_015699 [Rhizopus arrhizus]
MTVAAASATGSAVGALPAASAASATVAASAASASSGAASFTASDRPVAWVSDCAASPSGVAAGAAEAP